MGAGLKRAFAAARATHLNAGYINKAERRLLELAYAKEVESAFTKCVNVIQPRDSKGTYILNSLVNR